MTTGKNPSFNGLSRRRLLRQAVATGAGVGVLSAGIPGRFQFLTSAAAQDKPPIGTWPAGSEAGTVNVGAAVPLTGAYAVQGRAGAFVEALDGSPTNVIGLPLPETLAMLQDVGLTLPFS